jgi:hypothetical protein
MPENLVLLPSNGWLSASLAWRKTIITVAGSSGMLTGRCTAAPLNCNAETPDASVGYGWYALTLTAACREVPDLSNQ